MSLLGLAVNYGHISVVSYMLKENHFDEKNFNSIVLDCILSERVDVPLLTVLYTNRPDMFTV